MKALTLTQPWATLVALGVKQLETRSWLTHHRGMLAIHAAQALPRQCDRQQFAAAEYAGALEPVCGLTVEGLPRLELLPRGAVIATCRLTDCRPMLPPYYDPEGWAITNHERALGTYGPGRYAWALEDVLACEPVPCRGALGLWATPPGVLSQVFRA